jgi:hypothetical protein
MVISFDRFGALQIYDNNFRKDFIFMSEHYGLVANFLDSVPPHFWKNFFYGFLL